MSTQLRAARLTRIARACERVSDADLLLVAEVAEDRAIASARVVPWEVTPEMHATRNVLAEVTRG